MTSDSKESARYLAERYFPADIRLAGKAEDPLADDRALDLVGAARDRDAGHRDQDLGDRAAERRLRPGEQAGRPGDRPVHPRCLPGDVAAGQLSERALRAWPPPSRPRRRGPLGGPPGRTGRLVQPRDLLAGHRIGVLALGAGLRSDEVRPAG